MERIKTYKFKLRPNKTVASKFSQWLGVSRCIYNLCLEYRQMMYREHRISVSKTDLQREVKEVSKDYEWMREVHSQVRQNAIHRLCNAYDGFFKLGKGFPKFAKRDRYSSFTFPQGVKLNGNYIYLPKIGWVKMYANQSVPEGANIRTTTVKKEADGWHLSIVVKEAINVIPTRKNQAVGIDVGIAQYYVTSDGEYADNPRWLNQYAAKIRKQQRRLQRAKKGSKGRERAKSALAKTWLKIRRKRSDHIHKLTTNLVRRYDTIVVEDLRLKNMTKSSKGTADAPGKMVAQKSGLNRSLLDLGLGEFFWQLQYKSAGAGGEFVQVNPAYSSQECSECGHIAKENRLTQSQFVCVACGSVDNADENAAKVILGRGFSRQHQRGALARA